MVTFKTDFVQMSNPNYLCSKAWDDRVGVAIAIDSTYAKDVPQAKYGTNLGSGVTLSVMDGGTISNRELVYYMEDLCKELGIDFVYDFFPRGATDSEFIHLNRSGVVNMTLSIPSRYIHAHRSIIHRKDYADTVKLLVEFCKRVDWDLVKKLQASNR
ncbi:MAG: hypothetical protein SO103_05560 [Erysipelotrichaceae bacterium]|nr:hypothetical protein [Erysipelotrichaceae bacterium]